MHLNQTIQLTPKAFATRYAGHCDDQLEFMKHIVDVALPDAGLDSASS